MNQRMTCPSEKLVIVDLIEVFAVGVILMTTLKWVLVFTEQRGRSEVYWD